MCWHSRLQLQPEVMKLNSMNYVSDQFCVIKVHLATTSKYIYKPIFTTLRNSICRISMKRLSFNLCIEADMKPDNISVTTHHHIHPTRYLKLIFISIPISNSVKIKTAFPSITQLFTLFIPSGHFTIPYGFKKPLSSGHPRFKVVW